MCDRIRRTITHPPLTFLVTLCGLCLVSAIKIQAEDPPSVANSIVQGDPDAKPGNTPKTPKTFVISGACFDEHSNPLKGVKAQLYRRNIRYGTEITLVDEKQTVVEGGFDFENVSYASPVDEAHTSFAVVLTAPGRVSIIDSVQPQQLNSRKRFVMHPGATISGRVTDIDGRPVAGALVWTQGLVWGPVDGLSSSKTDDDGKYAIPDLSPFDSQTFASLNAGPRGRVSVRLHIRFRHPDFASGLGNYSRAPGTVDMVLLAGGSVEGRVIDAVTGSPAADVAVILRCLNLNVAEALRETRTDSTGLYSFKGLNFGEYVLVARAPDRTCVAMVPIHVDASQTIQNPDFELISGSLIVGKILGYGAKPVTHDLETGYRLRVGVSGPSCPKAIEGSEWVGVDDEGQFEIRVPPGLNRLNFQNSGKLWLRVQNRERFEQGIEVGAGETRRVIFRVLPEPAPNGTEIHRIR